MKILLVIDETPFYHPLFVSELIKKLKIKNYTIFGGLVTEIEPKNSIEKFIIKNLFKLHFSEIIMLSSRKIIFSFFSFIFPFGFFGKYFSVKSVFKKNKIPFFKIRKNINNDEYINKINNLEIDLIISSNSLYFGRKILDIPKLGSINRHTALLPSYGGLWPVLQAVASNEKETGVTIHKMTSKIDSGDILSQKKILIDNNKNLTKIYKEAFLKSPDLILDAIDNLLENKFLKSSLYKESYFSFPNNQQWDNFRKNGGRFI